MTRFIKFRFVSLGSMVTLCTSLAAFGAKPLPSGVTLIKSGTAIEGSATLSVYKFSNGLKLLVLPDFRNPLVSLRITLDGGSNQEVLGKTGLAHFFEHMMFRKTKPSAEGHYDRTLAGVGGQGNASTGTDFVSYESTFPAPALDQMLGLEKDRFTQLDLQDPYFTIEKGAVISERSLRYDNDPSARGNEILNKIVEKDTPYEWSTIGAKQDIENMTIADATAFYNSFYTPDNMQITVGGPMPAEQIVEKVHKAFGNIKGNKKITERKFPADYLTRYAGKSFVCSESVFDKRLQLVFPTADDSYRSSVLANILGSILASHPDGDLNYRMNSRKLAVAAYVYKEVWVRRFQPMNVLLKLSTQQDERKAEDFAWAALIEARNRPINETLKKIVGKQWDLDEAEASSRMTSLVKNYEWNSFVYNDPFISLNDRKILKNLTDAQFKNWFDSSFNKTNAFKYGVVPKSEGTVECSNIKGATPWKL